MTTNLPTNLPTSYSNYDNLPEIIITPTANNRNYWIELWQYRELLLHLTWRNYQLRYRQTVIGVAWAVIQPVVTMVVFSIFLGGIAGISSNGSPYPVFLYTGLVPWSYFADAIAASSASFINNVGLVKKVYFPRMILPMVYVLVGLVDFFIAFVILIGMLAAYRLPPSPWTLVIIPYAMLLCIMTAIGIGFALSAINVTYRDIGHIIPFLVQIWMFATPVVYSSAKIDIHLRALLGLNPMATVVECFRWALLQKGDFPLAMLLLSTSVTLLVFLVGTVLFRRLERNFSDVL